MVLKKSCCWLHFFCLENGFTTSSDMVPYHRYEKSASRLQFFAFSAPVTPDDCKGLRTFPMICPINESCFFRMALAIPQLEVYIIGSSLPEKWDRRILTFFRYGQLETWKLLLKSLCRSKACQNAYLRILACLCFCGFSGFQVP